jgi:hypothetical protein
MYYENELQSSSSFSFSVRIANSLLRYIGEGLQHNQLCVYLSLYNMEKDHLKTILSQILNLKRFQI